MPSDTDEKFFEYLLTLDASSLWVTGIPEGTLIFGQEPLLVIEGPVVLA